MKNLRLLIVFIFANSAAQGQYNPLSPPNTFNTSDNPLYWKNRAPNQDYWQQDVHYRIAANVDEKTDIISAKMELSYWNNSPDTLYEVFFHLYQNAFQPNSYADKNDQAQGRKNRFGKYEKDGKGTEILSFSLNDQPVEQELDNTILRVVPNSPILPNSPLGSPSSSVRCSHVSPPS